MTVLSFFLHTHIFNTFCQHTPFPVILFIFKPPHISHKHVAFVNQWQHVGAFWKPQEGGPCMVEDTIMALLSPSRPLPCGKRATLERGNMSHIMEGGRIQSSPPIHPSTHPAGWPCLIQFTPCTVGGSVSRQTHESQIYCITALFTVDHVTSLLAVLVWQAYACQLSLHVYTIYTSSGINLITSSLQNQNNTIDDLKLINNDYK